MPATQGAAGDSACGTGNDFGPDFGRVGGHVSSGARIAILYPTVLAVRRLKAVFCDQRFSAAWRRFRRGRPVTDRCQVGKRCQAAAFALVANGPGEWSIDPSVVGYVAGDTGRPPMPRRE